MDKVPDGVSILLADLLQTRSALAHVSRRISGKARSLLPGEAPSQFLGHGTSFEEVRPYQSGDDIRSIDWRISARTGETYTKVFSSERERPVYLAVDQRSGMFFGSGQTFKSVQAAKIASALAWHTLQQSESLGAQIVTDTKFHAMPARRGRGAVVQVLDQLARINQQLCHESKLSTPASASPPTLSSILRHCERVCRRGSTIYVVTDVLAFGPNEAKLLRTLSHTRRVTLVRVSDTLEREFHAAGKLSIIDTGRRQTISATRRFRQDLQAKQKQHETFLKDSVRKAGVRLIDADCNESIGQVLGKLLA